MNVLRAEVLGYCMGVRRAIDVALRVCAESCGRRIYTCGPLIHNHIVLDDFARRGICILDDSDDVSEIDVHDALIIIRAHGIPPCKETDLRARGARIFDATCPRVKKNQLTARELGAAGCTVFLAGEKKHGEIAGIQGYIPCAIVVETADEARAAAQSLYTMQNKNNAHFKTALLGQTTISGEEYRRIAQSIQQYFPALSVFDTLCGATEERQDALAALCARVEAVAIAGDAASANTRRLLTLARRLRPAWLIENADAIPPKLFNYTTVGLSAGASAPPALIDALAEKLRAGKP